MDKVSCRTPNAQGTTAIPAWKFDAVRHAILTGLDGAPVRASAVKGIVQQRMPAADLAKLGSAGWHATTVRLEMEVRGELERLPGAPLRLRKVAP